MLCAGTREAQERLHATPAMARIFVPDVTRHDYVALLRRLEAFHAGIEPEIAAPLKGLPAAVALLDGHRPQALAEDLAFFGASLSPVPALPALKGSARALGVLFALESCSLNASGVGPHLAGRLGVRAGRGASYFCGQAPDTARSRWRHVHAVLEGAALEAQGAEERLLAGASETLHALERWLRMIDLAPCRDPQLAEATPAGT